MTPANMTTPLSWKISKVFALLIAAIGLFVMWCWIFEQSTLDIAHPIIFEMTFTTAFCYLLIGLCYLLQTENTLWSKHLQTWLGSLLLTVGMLILIQYIFNISLGIDELLIKVQFTDGIKNPGRMSSLTATAFFASGLAIIISHSITSIRKLYFVYILILTVLLMGVLGVVQSEIFNLASDKLNVNRIAYHSSFCLVLFSAILWINWYHSAKKIDFQFTDIIIGNLVKLTIIYFGLVVIFSMFMIAFAGR